MCTRSEREREQMIKNDGISEPDEEGDRRAAADYVKFDDIGVNRSAIRRKTRDARFVARATISGYRR